MCNSSVYVPINDIKVQCLHLQTIMYAILIVRS